MLISFLWFKATNESYRQSRKRNRLGRDGHGDCLEDSREKTSKLSLFELSGRDCNGLGPEGEEKDVVDGKHVERYVEN